MRAVRPSAKNLASKCGYSVVLAERHKEKNLYSIGGTKKHERFQAALRSGGQTGNDAMDSALGVIRSNFPAAKWETEVKCKLEDPDTGEDLIPLGSGSCDAATDIGTYGVILELKFGATPVAHPDDNLQTRDYGLALALERGWTSFCVVIWQPLVSGFVYSRRFESSEFPALIAASRDACENDDTPNVGSHCAMECYRTSYCDAYVLPAVAKDTGLEPLCSPGGLTKDNFAFALATVDAMKKIVEKAETALKSFAREADGVDIGGGLSYGPSLVNGRQSISIEAAQEAGLYDLLLERGVIKMGHKHLEFRRRRIKDKGEKGNPHER